VNPEYGSNRPSTSAQWFENEVSRLTRKMHCSSLSTAKRGPCGMMADGVTNSPRTREDSVFLKIDDCISGMAG
jgi:hypothetical protein